MAWELGILNYDGPVPQFSADVDQTRVLPRGTLEDVRQHIDAVVPGTTWTEEPSLIEWLNAIGCRFWEQWDADRIAASSVPRLKACFERGELSLEMYGFEHPKKRRLDSFMLDVRGRGNPVPLLRAICKPKGWVAMEMGPEGEFFCFPNGANEHWGRWQDFLTREFGLTNFTENRPLTADNP